MGGLGNKKNGRRKPTRLDLTKPVERLRMPISVLARIFLVGSMAVVGSSYALYRHYYVPRPSMVMVMPVPSATAPTPEPSSSELIPVPELIPVAPD